MKKIPFSFLAAVVLFLLQFAAQAATITIRMSGTSFIPATTNIGVGDTVIWTNQSAGFGSTHTSTRGDPMCSTNGFGPTFWDSFDIVSHGTYTKTFTNFEPGNYTYICTLHCDAPQNMRGTLIITNSAAPNNPPTVSIAIPSPNSKFLAPADILLQATADDPDGGVTNVQFFTGGASLGNDSSAPFETTLNSVGAGNYTYFAVASDTAGAKATSGVVNVSVLTNATILGVTPLSENQFQLTISGTANQTYATEASSNLQSWTAFTTNLAPANIFSVTDSVPADVMRFYRARQDLN